MISECAWNKTWIPGELPDCKATSCQRVPFPPKRIGLVYTPDEKNNMTLETGMIIFKPSDHNLKVFLLFSLKIFISQNSFGFGKKKYF